MNECPFRLPIRSHKADDGFYRIRGNNSHAICKEIAEKDEVDYIVQAVNSHKDLVEACKRADKALNICLRYLLGTGPQPNPEDLSEAPIKLKAALAKVEKEK